jgi:hypothetical protein
MITMNVAARGWGAVLIALLACSSSGGTGGGGASSSGSGGGSGSGSGSSSGSGSGGNLCQVVSEKTAGGGMQQDFCACSPTGKPSTVVQESGNGTYSATNVTSCAGFTCCWTEDHNYSPNACECASDTWLKVAFWDCATHVQNLGAIVTGMVSSCQ